MKRNMIGIPGLIFLVCIFLVVACSDDDPTAPVTPTEGSPDDPSLAFVRDMSSSDPLVQTQTTYAVLEALIVHMVQLNKSPEIPLSLMMPANSVTAQLTSVTPLETTADLWYPFLYEAVLTIYGDGITGTAYIAGIDSLQLRNLGEPVPFQGGSTAADAVYTRNHAHWTDSLLSYGSIHNAYESQVVSDGDLFGALVNFTIHDTTHTNIIGENWGCDIQVASDGQADSVLYEIGFMVQLCAIGGEFDMTHRFSSTCSDTSALKEFDIDGAWNVTGTIDTTGVFTVRYSHNNLYWNVTENCGD